MNTAPTIYHYVDYFRFIAASHVGINHVIASEGPDGNKSERKFAVFTSDEVVGGLRSTIGDGVVLLLHPYYSKPASNGAGHYYMENTGAFLLVEKCNHDNSSEVTLSLFRTEEIVYNILNQIIHDTGEYGFKCPVPKPFTGMDWNDVLKIEPVLNVFEGRAGWYVEFKYRMNQNKGLMNPDLHNDTALWQPIEYGAITYPNT